MGRRLLRVNESIRESLSKAIPADLTDPRLGFVTVTGVETSADLRHARVYVSVLGNAVERERTLAALRSSHGRLQERLAADIRLKRTPQLEFFYDESIDRGQRIEQILRRHASELGAEEAASPDGGAADEGRGEEET